MIEGLILYISSVIISYLIDKTNYYNSLQEINRRGKYVIKDLYDIAFDKVYGTSIWQMLIPIYNIIKSMYNGLVMTSSFENFYELLDKENVFERMEHEKRVDFYNSPSLAKAKKITKNHEKEIKNYSKVIFNDYSIIFFDSLDNSNNSIKRVIGPLSKENRYYQIDKLNHAVNLYSAFIDVVYKNSLSEVELNSLKVSQYTFDLTHIDDSISIDEFKNNLQDMLKEDNYIVEERDSKTLKRTLKK